jgi:hypothetical protein
MSCTQNEGRSNAQYPLMQNKYYLKQDSLIVFPLDTNTIYGSNCLQIINIDQSPQLAYLNEESNSIYLYEISTKKLVKILEFDREGPNSIVALQGFYYHPPDSLFLFNEYSVYLSDTLGRIKAKYNLAKGNGKREQLLHPLVASTVNQVAIIGDTLYLSGMPERDFFTPEFYDGSQVVICLNLQTANYGYKLGYPEIYKNNIWGNNLAYFYNCFNSRNNIFVYSFPLDPNLLATNCLGKITNHFAGSNYLGEVAPAKKGLNARERQMYYLAQPSYFAIYYDPYRNFYYRIAHQPLSDEEILSNKRVKRCSIIILDGNLNWVGETVLPDGQYTETMVFSTPSGFFIGYYDRENENNLSFRKFSLQKYEN